jgi:mannose-1-phosphate guanylyltransferase
MQIGFWALSGAFFWWNGFLWAVSALMESLRAHFISIIRACVRTKQRKITTKRAKMLREVFMAISLSPA